MKNQDYMPRREDFFPRQHRNNVPTGPTPMQDWVEERGGHTEKERVMEEMYRISGGKV